MKKFIAIAMAITIAAVVAAPASALTIEELTAQIVALTAQLAQLQAQLGQVGGSTGSTACTITSFDRNLAQGASGADVQCLQKVLNSAADTQVASTGAGSPGNETTYFGGLTKAAVVKFQNKYASTILAPVGLTAGTGYVGPATRPKLNTMLSGGVVPPVTPPVTGTGLNVALAATNPVSGTLVDNQSVAPMARYIFTNGDNVEAKITTVKLNRIGVSSDTDLDNIYLFDGALRLTDAASVSSGIITFNDPTGIFAVPAYSSKTITVTADIANNISGRTVGVNINSSADVSSTATSTNGLFPLNGNLMTIADGSLATFDFTVAPEPSSSPTVNPQNDYVVWRISPNIGTRALNMTRLSLRQIGSINYADLQNFRLYVAGEQVATVHNLDSKGYVTFDLSAAPKRLETGARELKVLADIINGSNRTFSFSLRVAADVNVVDTQYNVNVRPTLSSSTFTARTTGSVTVGTGTLTFQKDTTSPSGDIINNGANVTLAKYKLTAAGERVKVETLYVSVAVVDTSDDPKGGADANEVGWLRNGALYANGIQVGSTSNLYEHLYTTVQTTFNLGSSLIVEPGNPVMLEVRADIYDGDGDNDIIATDKITATVEGSDSLSNAQGMSSLETIDVPSSDQAANQVIVAAGGLTLSKYTAYANQTMVAPVNTAKLAHFTLTANTTEAVNLSTITVDIDSVTGNFDASSDLTNLYVVYGTSTSSVKSSVADSANDFSVNYTLVAGQTIDLMVYADVASTAYASLTSTGRVDVTITGTSASSGAAANAAEKNGQTITFSTGSFAAVKSGDSPIAQAVAGQQTITSAKFKFSAISDTYTIKELRFTVGTDAISAAILSAALYDGGTQKGNNVTWDSTNDRFAFTGLNIPVSANTSKTLEVKFALSEPVANDGTSQVNVATTLAWMKYSSDSAGQVEDDNPSDTAEITGGTDPVGSAIYVYKTIPTFTVQSLPSTVLTNGTSQTLYKFAIAADAKGPVAVKQLVFTTTITAGSGNSDQNLDYFKFLRGSDDISSLVTILNGSEANLEVDGTACTEVAACTVTVTFATEETIAAGSSATYSLKATSAGMGSSTEGKDSVSTSLLGDATEHNGAYTYLNLGGNATINELYTSAAGTTTDAAPYNVIWSDNSAIGHSSTVGTASSGDWANGYLIKDLPLDAMSLINP